MVQQELTEKNNIETNVQLRTYENFQILSNLEQNLKKSKGGIFP